MGEPMWSCGCAGIAPLLLCPEHNAVVHLVEPTSPSPERRDPMEEHLAAARAIYGMIGAIPSSDAVAIEASLGDAEIIRAALTVLSSERARDRERIALLELELKRREHEILDESLVNTRLTMRVKVLTAAIRWALGEGGDFGDEIPNKVGRYWWRTELRKRAALGNPQSSTGLGQGEGNG